MTTNKMRVFISCFCIALFLAIGCSEIEESNLITNVSQKKSAVELTVSAASSLTDVLKTLKPLYEQTYPNIEINYNLSGSGSLRQQIEQGAPVDIFFSASTKDMDILVNKELIREETLQALVKNQMVLIVNRDNNSINSFEDLVSDKYRYIALGQPFSVPAGKYAQEILASFQILDQVKSKLIYTKDVRQVLGYVATGNVDAGIVYRTDASISDRVKIVAIAPEKYHSRIIYPIGVVKNSKQPEISQNFLKFMNTKEVEAVFTQYGFTLNYN